jgi:hypothetical protein
MTTQEDYAVKEEEVVAATTQAENEDSEEATNTQEDYDNLLAEKIKLEEEKENYRKAALKYKKGAKSLDDEEEETIEVKDTNSKTFTADEVQEIATKAAEAALGIERAKTEQVIKTNEELKRSLTGKAPSNGISGEGAIDTSKTSSPHFNDAQVAFLKKLGITEEEVMKTKEKNKNFLS